MSQTLATPSEHDTARAAGAKLRVWFDRHGRAFPWRSWTDRYRLVVVETLLQRTRADVVARFQTDFFERYPTATDLAKANVTDLQTLLSVLGLQRRRSQTLRAAAVGLVNGTPVRELPGVGQYIERALAVGETNEVVAMVDTNFVRVLGRVFGGPWMADYRFDARLQELAQSVVEGSEDSRTGNWAVLDLGATVCLPKRPECTVCPLLTICKYGAELERVLQEGQPSEFGRREASEIGDVTTLAALPGSNPADKPFGRAIAGSHVRGSRASRRP